MGRDRRLELGPEGCLSLPGAYALLARPDQAVCRGQDQFGASVEVVATGQFARCVQHETDHLSGVVFGDRLPARSRKQLDAAHRLAAHRYPGDWPRTPERS